MGAEEVRSRRQRHRDQGRQHDALQRPGLGLRHHRQGRGCLFQEDQRRGRHQRAQDQLHQPRRRLQPAESGRRCAAPGRAGPSAAHLGPLGHAVQFGDPEVHEREKGAAAARLYRRQQVERPDAFSLDHGLAAQLPGRGQDLRGAHSENQAGCENRRALPERRLRQGLPGGFRKRAGRQGEDHDCRQGFLRDQRSDRGLADRATAGLRRECVFQYHHAEIRGAGDPQGLRYRLEAGGVSEQRFRARSDPC